MMQPDVILPNPSPAPITPVAQDAYGMMNPGITPMDGQNTNFTQTSDIIAPTPGPEAVPPEPVTPMGGAMGPDSDSVFARLKAYLSEHRLQSVIGLILVLFLLGNLGVSYWLYKKINNYSALSAVGLKKVAATGGTFNGDDTLYINTKNKGVGVGASSPDGLQVTSPVTNTGQKSPNVRIGLLNGEPAVFLEGKDANQWEMGVSNASLQLGQAGTAAVQIDKNGLSTIGNTTLGNAANNVLTIQAGSISAPNNLNIGNNALFVDSAHGSVAIGANNSSGFKLLVAGNFKANGSIQSGGQFIGVSGSASSPSISFSGATNTGLYNSGSNSASISAGGTETLKVQPGTVSVLNGASLSVDGFISSGGSSPAWQVVRLTGTLNGSGSGTAAHGISNASPRVIMAMAWYQSGSQAKPLSVDYVDGNNMQVDGGSPGAPWRGMIMYTQDTAGW